MYLWQDSTLESNKIHLQATIYIHKYSYDEDTRDYVSLEKTLYGITTVSLCFLEYFLDHYWLVSSSLNYEVTFDQKGDIEIVWDYNINEYDEDITTLALEELEATWKTWGHGYSGEC